MKKDNFIDYVLVILFFVMMLLLAIYAIKSKDSSDKIEQYYLEADYFENKSTFLIFGSEYGRGEIVHTYSDYIEKYGSKLEIIDLLKGVVDEKFFDTKSLVILEEDTSNVSLEGYINRIKIVENEIEITIKRKYKEYGSQVATEDRTYFIPIENKEVTNVKRNYVFTISILSDLIIPLIICFPLIMFIASIITFIKEKKYMKEECSNKDNLEENMKSLKRKFIKRIIIAIIMFGFIRI